MITALYNPGKGSIGCVLLQAGCGGSSEVAQMFDPSDWDLAPEEGQKCMQATAAQWRQLASMTKDERIERFNKYSR